MATGTTSWIDTYTQTQTPCVTGLNSGNTGVTGSFSSCIVWLIAGVIIGGLTFQKKGKTT
jgi:hypothetical protein